MDDKIELDQEQKLSGRGAYLCSSSRCCEKAVRKEMIIKHLKVSPPDDFEMKLKAALK